MNATATAVLVLLLAACSSSPSPGAMPGAIGFDGPTTEGWRFGSTGGTGPHATWKAQADAAAVSRPNVLALTAPNHDSEDRFNVAWTPNPKLGDVRLRVAVRADGGEVDQGGGPMWRVQSDDDYYLCRFNPLESNFRVYVVKDGVRRQLATALCDAKVGTWHVVEVEHRGGRVTCWLDGSKLLEADDATIPGAGGIGLWTKADACTSFDDLVASPLGG